MIVVGNLSVGGTGKTPLTIWLVNELRQLGYNPGVICKGYGSLAASSPTPQLVNADSDPKQCGDEPLLIAKRCQCPVAVGQSRVNSARFLFSETNTDIIISDDGLQHLALNRTMELVVIDGIRKFGNGYCLPAGPLREPVSRLDSVDFVISNGKQLTDTFFMRVSGDQLVNLTDKSTQVLTDLSGSKVHVVTAIGNPQRFLSLLEVADIEFDTRIFPDHHMFKAADLIFNDHQPILMTEKDAVKCYHLANPSMWALVVNAQIDNSFKTRFRQHLEHYNGRF